MAAQRGWGDYCIYVELTDVNAKWWVEKRPAFKRLVEDIRARRVIAVCARHTDRLWRGDIQNKFLKELSDHRAELWDFTCQREFKSAQGRFAIQMLSAAGEYEVNLTGERIREMKRGKALGGQPGGGPPPFGYTSQSRRKLALVESGAEDDEAYRQACVAFPIGNAWYIDEVEGPVVRIIFALYTAPDTQWGTKRIARYLSANGHRAREGGPWSSNTIRKLIANPVYGGYTTFDEDAYTEKVPSSLPRRRQKRFQGKHPLIIPAEQWERAQEIRDTQHSFKRTRPGPKSSEVFSLVGILRCPKCGKSMIGKLAGSSNKSQRRYYMCGLRHTSGPDQCDFPLIDAVALQREVWSWLHDVLQLTRLRARARAAAASEARGADPGPRAQRRRAGPARDRGARGDGQVFPLARGVRRSRA